jgi:copper(I)-binding protein
MNFMGRVNMKRKQFNVSYLFLYFLLMAVLAGCSEGTPQISIKDAKFIPSQMLIGRASSFMKIINDGEGSDALKGCQLKEHPSARGEIHDSVDGRMVKIEKVNIPPGHNTDLKMGSFHLMFFGLPEKIEEEVTLVLFFQKSGSIEVTVPVSMMAGHAMNH